MFATLFLFHLKDSDDCPEQGVKILSVWNRVSRLRLQTELTAKDVHPQNTNDKKKNT